MEILQLLSLFIASGLLGWQGATYKIPLHKVLIIGILYTLAYIR